MFSQITYPNNDVKFLYERSGKKVHELIGLEGGLNNTPIALNNLESGMYLVNVFTKSDRKLVRLIIH